MADLDNFFAKKDKKKRGKAGFSKANTDVLAKNLEEADLKEKKAEAVKTHSGALATSEATKLAFEGASIEHRQNSQNDEEWLDYKREKDYSGLKIETLKVSDPVIKDEEETEEVNEDGEKVMVKKAKDKVWSKNNQDSGNASSPETERRNNSDDDEEEDKDEEKEANADKAADAPASGPPKSSYVPPHMRNQSSGPPSMASGPGMQATRLVGQRGPRNRAAPDINSEVYFPSLSATGGPDENNKGKNSDYQEVRSGGGQRDNNASKSIGNQKISLGNKYDALRNEN